MTYFWLLTFGLIGFWFLAGVVDLIRTPKTLLDKGNGRNLQLMPN